MDVPEDMATSYMGESTIHPLLLKAALLGSRTDLLSLLDTSADVKEGIASSAASLLEGVTHEGDTALHVVATNGDSTQFLACASLIHIWAQHLLFFQNFSGETPVHCAARARKSNMVSHLIDLATSVNFRNQQQLLRTENKRKETALHEAVRIGDKGIVEMLMEADPELANYPVEGISPLYLAISLQKNSIAQTLCSASDGRDSRILDSMDKMLCMSRFLETQ